MHLRSEDVAAVLDAIQVPEFYKELGLDAAIKDQSSVVRLIAEATLVAAAKVLRSPCSCCGAPTVPKETRFCLECTGRMRGW